MLRLAVSKAVPVALRPALLAAAPRAAAPAATTVLHQQQRFCSSKPGSAPPTKDDGGDEIVKVVLADSLEWTLSSPPPIHQFDEPPIIVEIGEA